jgi:hypothetical protein
MNRERKVATDAFENLSDDQRAAKPVNPGKVS